MPEFTPTSEQNDIIDAFNTGGHMVIEAGAGTGKTSTLKLLSKTNLQRRGLYIAYNKSIATEAQGTFPKNIECRTAHSLAFGTYGRKYVDKLNAPRMKPWDIATLLGIHAPLQVTTTMRLKPWQVARLVLDTVGRFCYSSDTEPGPRHVPFVEGCSDMPTLRRKVGEWAKDAWQDILNVNGKLPFTHDCQPPGTLVRRVVQRGGTHGDTTFEEIPIEEIREGDRVVSFTNNQRRGYVRRDGRLVSSVGSRQYDGELIRVETERGRTSSYTDSHICIARLDCDLDDGNHLVYLSRRGEDYRIGRTTWRTRSQGNALGIRRRAESMGADAVWVLSVHDTDADAALAEAVVAHRFHIPTWQFRSVNPTVRLDDFWRECGNNEAQAASCLRDFGRILDYPFWARGDGWQNTRRPVEVRACNLLPGMMLLEPDEIQPGHRGELWAHDGTSGWSSVSVTRQPYSGPVYSMDVEEDHTYVADGIVTHNCYLKMWELDKPHLNYDFVMLDEAQDANPCIASIFDSQDHAQRVSVGDACQSIYQWRGATDYLSEAAEKVDHHLLLSQSFRFGPAVADEANKWLTLLESPLHLQGYDAIPSRLVTLDQPDTILARTNAEVVDQAIQALDDNRKVAVVGGLDQVANFAKAAEDLMRGKGTSHRDLQAFSTWAEVQEYVQTKDGRDLAVFVRLIDNHGTQRVQDIASATVSEARADIVVSTAHKAKGREWQRVKIASDFREPSKDEPEISRPESMLAYVSVTRAQLELDRSGLAFVDRLLAQPKEAAAPA